MMRRHAVRVAEELEKRSYDELVGLEYPVAYSEMLPEGEVQVEVVLLEQTPEYVHLSVDVSGSWWTDFFPEAADTIVCRDRGWSV